MSTPYKHVGAAAKMGEIFTDSQAEANKWKLRMLRAGIPGLSIPDNWDELSEDAKQTRLDKVINMTLEDT
jgi:hypothetical protein